MTKLMVIAYNNNIKNINADAFLYGIKGMSVNMPIYYSIDELEIIINNIKKEKKEVFISLNKNMHNKDLDELENILNKLSNLNIDGIFYYDVAVLSLAKKLKINIPLVWSAEHLTTNYSTINYWNKYGVTYTNISCEITKDEILDIRKNTDSKLIATVFGYLPMFVSKRHLVDCYLEKFKIKDNSKQYYLEKNNEMYPIVDDSLGTNIYSSKILNGYSEYLTFVDNNIDYVLLNSYLIDDEIFIKIVDIFKNKSTNGEEEISKLLNNNVDKGFLYKETIYKVKK